jgi:hypothetical protein
MRISWLGFCVALAVVLLACASPAAAEDMTISLLGPSGSISGFGTWDSSTKIFSLYLHFGLRDDDTLTIDSGVTLAMGEFYHIDLHNHGTIDNHGTISLRGGWLFNFNRGLIRNYGTIDNYGAILNHGTIDNYGLIRNLDATYSDIYNDGTINNYGTIDNGGTIDNDGTITNFGGEITGNPVEGNPVVDSDYIPEFPTIALPVASILGLLFLFNYRKRRKED